MVNPTRPEQLYDTTDSAFRDVRGVRRNGQLQAGFGVLFIALWCLISGVMSIVIAAALVPTTDGGLRTAVFGISFFVLFGGGITWFAARRMIRAQAPRDSE